MTVAIYISIGLASTLFAYLFSRFVFDLLLRGFVPILRSRPWVVDQIIGELKFDKADLRCLAFSTGRSGLLQALEKKYPKAELTGIEPSLFPFIVAKVQAWLRFTRIKIRREAVHRVPVKGYDLVYCHLYPDAMRGLGKKLKFECDPGTVVVSAGFVIPDLGTHRAVPLPDRKGRFDWLSKNQKLFQSKAKKFKKENKAFFYVI
jgi:hypothetical protein